jgi:serine phosphatase RsbU (regulator of sigma subunit)
MIQLLVLLQTAALAAFTWARVVRARVAEATPSRLIAIGALLAAQAVILDLSLLHLLPATWREGMGSLPGLIWITQAARASLLLIALTLWYGMSRDDLSARRYRVWLVLALLAQAFGGGGMPFVGMAILLWLTGRAAWTRELSGWRRFAILITGPLLFLLITLWPHGMVREGRLVHHLVALGDPWQMALIGGSTPRPLQLELAIARPLDRFVQAALDLFRAQLLVLSLRALTLPMRLYGMSLKRRFMVNYVFVRSIPSVLGLITLLGVAYVAFGVHKAGQVRGDLERMLARSDAAGAALLHDPRTHEAGVAAILDSARRWLGPDGARAHLVLRQPLSETGDSIAVIATPGTPDSLRELTLPAIRGSRRAGAIEREAGLYLFVRRTTQDSARIVDVLVPIDSTYLSAIARRVGARISLNLDRGVSTQIAAVSFGSDTTGRQPIRVRSGPALQSRGLFLGRTYLPLGDWETGWRQNVRGVMALELHATPRILLGSLIHVPGWLIANAVMVTILLVLAGLVAIIEGVAVRSGRGIVQSIEEEVAHIREGATRFGGGELDHRIPVRGKDELSVLAGSLNDMAASLERQRTELIEKERFEEELEVARGIQRRFLPQRPPEVPGLRVAGISVPSREVGGDLYHYAELPGPRLALALGDVSGKSVPAALIMSNVMSALRAEAQHESEVQRSLERINRLIVEQIEPGRFVTLFYGVADPGAGRLRYTSAGHNPALHVPAHGDLRWLGEGGVPLGVLPAAQYPAAEIAFGPGDMVVAYSDGVTEAEGPIADGEVELFGEQRLADVVSRMRNESPQAIIEAVLAEVRRFAAGRPQTDDITLVVLRRV